MFACPVCGQALEKTEQVYRCTRGHSFDVSGQGYVHLLPANRMNSPQPGDDREMVAARSRLLAQGYYAPLRTLLAQLAAEYAPTGARVLDLGCGEGYYTAGVLAALAEAGKKPLVAGVDISKAAAKLAARACPTAEIAVASVFHLPVADCSVDFALNCFSPLCIPEILRVLGSGGYFAYVVPGAQHLWGLKTAVYSQPYPNETKETPYPGFSYLEIRRAEGSITLACNRDILDIFRMTPYFWKTSREDQQKLAAMESLETPIAFDVHLYKKD